MVYAAREALEAAAWTIQDIALEARGGRAEGTLGRSRPTEEDLKPQTVHSDVAVSNS